MAGILLVVLVTLAFTQSITAPLATLAETVEQIAAGNLDILAPVGREDETGVLARSFNIMTLRLLSERPSLLRSHTSWPARW